MHDYAHTFVETAADVFDIRGPVYEFGFSPTMHVPEEATSRDCFAETGYIGCELGDTATIDRLEDLARLPFPDDAARTIVCMHTLEHVFEPQRVIEEMIRILAPGGLLILCAAVESGESETLDDYWRPTPQAIERLLAPMGASTVAWQGLERSPHTVFAIGAQSPIDERFLHGVNRLASQLPKRFDELASDIAWGERFRRYVFGWMQSREERRRQRHFHRVQFAIHVPVTGRFDPEMLLGCQPEESTGTRLDLSQ